MIETFFEYKICNDSWFKIQTNFLTKRSPVMAEWCWSFISSSLSSLSFLQHFMQLRQHEGRVQKRIRRRAKKTPQPTRDGPMSFSSRVLKPLSPKPTKVITSPIHIIPSPTYRTTFALPLALYTPSSPSPGSSCKKKSKKSSIQFGYI